MKQPLSVNLFDIPTAIGGTNLPASFQERVAFGRAVIKRPDVLVFNETIAGQDAEAQKAIRDRLSLLLPETTQIYINDSFDNPDSFDMYVDIRDGRMITASSEGDLDRDEEETADDLRRKQRILAKNPLFANLAPRTQRLLAFAAQWYSAEKGQTIFAEGDRADAAYLCLEGLAQLRLVEDDGSTRVITDVEPGRLIGDLAIILDEPRQLDLVATEEVKFLRIGADQFRSVVESDKAVMLSLLRTVSGHLSSAAELLVSAGVSIPQEMGPPRPPLTKSSEAK